MTAQAVSAGESVGSSLWRLSMDASYTAVFLPRACFPGLGRHPQFLDAGQLQGANTLVFGDLCLEGEILLRTVQEQGPHTAAVSSDVSLVKEEIPESRFSPLDKGRATTTKAADSGGRRRRKSTTSASTSSAAPVSSGTEPLPPSALHLTDAIALPFEQALGRLFRLVAATLSQGFGGHVLVPCRSCGLCFDVLESCISYLRSVGSSDIPVFLISPVAHSSLNYLDICAEWLVYDESMFSCVPVCVCVFVHFCASLSLSLWVCMYVCCDGMYVCML